MAASGSFPGDQPSAPERPVIGFLTDYGLDGAAAICRGVMLSFARDAQIVDICHTVAKYSIRDGAYLLSTAVPWLPVGTHVAVVDPGVGTDRRAIGLLTARGDALVGPDNGLLLPAARRLGGVVAARLLENRDWLLPTTSATFHGRDIFAPVAGHLARGEPFAAVGREIDSAQLVQVRMPEAAVEPGVLRTGVTYVDSFGNLRLAGGTADLAAALGPLEPGAQLLLDLADGRGTGGVAVRWSRTFGDAGPGELLAYEDSSGNLAIAESGGSAANRLHLASGSELGIRRT
jgi:S-adenosyl-L-methionine hydrolase (adenosine-forming)